MQTIVWRWALRAPALVVLLLVGWSPALAEEIPWQGDYAQARQVAAVQNRPLVLSVESRDCPWCRKLHETTFHDPAVARMLARWFVPLYVEAEREAQLVQALQIQTFPTVIFAAADGTILHTVTGYVDAAKMNQHILLAQARLNALEEKRHAPAMGTTSSSTSSSWEYPLNSTSRAPSWPGRRC